MDYPANCIAHGIGAALTVVGVGATLVASRRAAGLRRDLARLDAMWTRRSTVKELRHLAESSKPLPSAVLLAGRLRGDGSGLTPFTKQAFGGAAVGDAGYLLTECLVTRLACIATRVTEKEGDGTSHVRITRIPRAGRVNVHHCRQVAEGLSIIGLAGEIASVTLPEYDVCHPHGEPPSLFLTSSDPVQDLGGGSVSTFAHMSKFVIFDQLSTTDLGAGFTPSSQASSKTSSTAEVSNDLDAVGAISAEDWLWHGQAFYDHRADELTGLPAQDKMWSPKHAANVLLSYNEFMARATEAAEENSANQDATELSPDGMRAARDRENCFRIVEVAIPGCDVVILGKPSYDANNPSRPISIGPFDGEVQPTGPAGDSSTLQFRILKGHTIDNLQNQLHQTLGFHSNCEKVGIIMGGIGILVILYGVATDQRVRTRLIRAE